MGSRTPTKDSSIWEPGSMVPPRTTGLRGYRLNGSRGCRYHWQPGRTIERSDLLTNRLTNPQLNNHIHIWLRNCKIWYTTLADTKALSAACSKTMMIRLCTTNNDQSFSKKLQQSMMNPSANCRTTTNIHLAPTMMNPAANSRPTNNQSCQPFTAHAAKRWWCFTASCRKIAELQAINPANSQAEQHQ